jgi:hypothetical protein
MNRFLRITLPLAVTCVAMMFGRGIVWAQRGTGFIATPTTANDTCITAVSIALGPAYLVEKNVGDPVVIKYKLNTDTLRINRIELSISYKGTTLTYDSTQTSGYPKPWVTGNWQITHNATDSAVNAVVVFSDSTMRVNDTLLGFHFTVGCIADDGRDTVRFIGTCADDTNSVYAVNIGKVGPGTRTNRLISSWNGEWFGASMLGDTSAIDQPLLLVVQCVAPRQPENGFDAKVAFDDLKVDFDSVQQYGTFTQGKTLLLDTIVVPGGEDTLVVTTDDPIEESLSMEPFFNVWFTNTMAANHDSTQVNLAMTIYDCANEAFSSGPNTWLRTRYVATIAAPAHSTAKNTVGSAAVTITCNFPVNMRTEEDRAQVIFNDATWSSYIRVDSVVDNASDSLFWVTDTSGGNFRVREDPNYTSNHIPVSAGPRTLFTLWYTTLTTCGTASLDLVGGDSSGACRLMSSDGSDIVLHSTGNGDLTLDDGSVAVTGCGGGDPNPSCPFVSVWGGNSFVEENTILTQSEYTPQGVAVVDYYKLTAKPEVVDGVYRLRVEEREDETSYLDQMKLLAVEAEAGRDVGVTDDGRVFYADLALTPVAASDDRGSDALAAVRAKDGDVYASTDPGWLVVTYEVTSDRGGDVFLGQSAGLKDNCPRELKLGDGRPRKTNRLEISYREDGGTWTTLPPGPPRDRSANAFEATDLSLRAGSVIEVKYAWTSAWSTDDLTLAVASNDAPPVTAIAPQAAFHSGAGKATKALDEADDEFAVLNRGDAVTIDFAAGRRAFSDQGTVFIIAAKGYYTPYARADAGTLPGAFALHPSYPNPFNAQTRIEFALPVESQVDITIYNVLGQKVKSLASGVLPAGERSLLWDGTNDAGTAVASGAYFVTMKAGDFEQKRKMTLLK